MKMFTFCVAIINISEFERKIYRNIRIRYFGKNNISFGQYFFLNKYHYYRTPVFLLVCLSEGKNSFLSYFKITMRKRLALYKKEFLYTLSLTSSINILWINHLPPLSLSLSLYIYIYIIYIYIYIFVYAYMCVYIMYIYILVYVSLWIFSTSEGLFLERSTR